MQHEQALWLLAFLIGRSGRRHLHRKERAGQADEQSVSHDAVDQRRSRDRAVSNRGERQHHQVHHCPHCSAIQQSQECPLRTQKQRRVGSQGYRSLRLPARWRNARRGQVPRLQARPRRTVRPADCSRCTAALGLDFGLAGRGRRHHRLHRALRSPAWHR
jgi:hypothetical protein